MPFVSAVTPSLDTVSVASVPVSELPADELGVGGRAGVSVIGRLVDEVLHEEQVVRPGGITVDPEGQRACLLPWAPGCELLDDCLGCCLLTGLERNRENLADHQDSLSRTARGLRVVDVANVDRCGGEARPHGRPRE